VRGRHGEDRSQRKRERDLLCFMQLDDSAGFTSIVRGVHLVLCDRLAVQSAALSPSALRRSILTSATGHLCLVCVSKNIEENGSLRW
jgi:hypothetical protein